MKEIIKKNKNILLILIDVVIIISCYIISMMFLDVHINDIKTFAIQLAIVVITYQIFLNVFRMYKNMMRYEVGKDYIKYIMSAFLSMIILSLINKAFNFEYINLKINGEHDSSIEEYEEDDDIDVFISELTNDGAEKEILRFFSANSFDDESIKVACKKFNVTQDYINGMFTRIRNSLSIGKDRDD